MTSSKPRPLKLFHASGYPLPVPDEHRGNNGNRQVRVLIRCATKRRFAELVTAINGYASVDKQSIDSSYRYLSTYCCWHEVTPDHSRYARENAVAEKPDTIYYNPGGCRLGYIDQWFELEKRKPELPVSDQVIDSTLGLGLHG